MKQKSLALCLVLFTIVTILFVFPSTLNASAAEGFTVTAESTNGTPGGYAEVKVNIKNNPGIASLVVDVSYDSTYLTLSEVVLKDNDLNGALITTSTPVTNPQKISILHPNATFSANGVIATLRFSVSEEVAEGYFTEIALSYNPENVFDAQMNPVSLTTVGGGITITSGMPGDVNQDGKVTNMDAILLFRHVAGWSDPVDDQALDVNGDGKIGNMDAIVLFRSIAGWADVQIGYGNGWKLCKNHTLSHISRTEPTCQTEGVLEHWVCTKCQTKVSNPDTMQVVTDDALTISKRPHTEIVLNGYGASCSVAGKTDGLKCDVCHTVLQEQVPIAAKGHDFSKSCFCEACDVLAPDFKAISTATDLMNIEASMGGKYYLANDITLSTAVCLGKKLSASFTGILDGNGHSISNITGGAGYDGLFYQNAGTIRNLTISNVSCSFSSGKSNVTVIFGGITAKNSGSIINCTVTDATIRFNKKCDEYHLWIKDFKDYHYKATYEAAAIAAVNVGTIDNCRITGEVKFEVTTYVKANFGAISGFNQDTSYGIVTLDARLGAITANNLGTVRGCSVNAASLKSEQTANAHLTRGFSGAPTVPMKVLGTITFGSIIGENQGTALNNSGKRPVTTHENVRLGRKKHATASVAVKSEIGYGLIGHSTGGSHSGTIVN